ncbi:MAG: hypothetical protein MZW92_74960 [Comamonadaceae bacterium]|nr:hypothetical protein [Comamonadaceae bacterium]
MMQAGPLAIVAGARADAADGLLQIACRDGPRRTSAAPAGAARSLREVPHDRQPHRLHRHGQLPP